MSSTFPIINPFNDELIAMGSFTSKEELYLTLGELTAGREIQTKTPAFERSNILAKLADLLNQNSEQLAQLITQETGKTISDSRVEIQRSINTTKASSEEARQISGETLDSDAYPPQRGRIGITCWRPIGTVLCITPFNFPINIAMHKLGPAYAAGNTILFKPNPQNLLSSQYLLELCYKAGIPKKVLKLAVPDIKLMSELIAHRSISCINFTGGEKAADAIASASSYKKLLFELGGNDSLIVLPDGNLEAAADAAINQRFATAGQRCTAAKRLFIHQDVYEKFKSILLEKTLKLNVGDPRLEDTFVGPVINSAAADHIQSVIDSCVRAGASLLTGGGRTGNIIEPTILENLEDNSPIMTEEIFGPVVPLRKFQDLDEIIPVINSTDYGLQAGVFSSDLGIIRRLFEELEVGTLASNDGPGFRAEHFPFGGVKQSGIGREGIKYAIREMSYLKTLVL